MKFIVFLHDEDLVNRSLKKTLKRTVIIKILFKSVFTFFLIELVKK